jgi:phosphoribosyl 1,2-cyclic phosphodiesterase
MSNSMRVKLWGIRGSLPAPHAPAELKAILSHFLLAYKNSSDQNMSPEDFINSYGLHSLGGYGGHTSCVEVSNKDALLIVDGGSGLRRLGDSLLTGPLGRGQGTAHILLTHFHWDHLIGLPFFVPLFIPGNVINFYSPHEDLEENIRLMFRKPNFPVNFSDLASKIVFHRLEPRTIRDFSGLQVIPYQLDHPDPCWGYRFECGGKVYSHCVDSEMTRISRADLAEDLPLYQNVDLALFDAQYTFVEATEKINWGHASAPVGLDLAMREGIKKVLFVHHDPGASDVRIEELERQTRNYYEISLKHSKQQKRPHFEVDWSFAREEQEFHL